MGSSDSSSDNTVRFAPYLETAHSKLLDRQGVDENAMSFMEVFNATLCKHEGLTDEVNERFIDSPYRGYEQIDINDSFFGSGYTMESYPTHWDMFGKFIAGLDVHDLWAQTYVDVVQGPEIENVISAQSALLQDDIDTTIMPKFLAGMRDINSIVGASAFVAGKGIIQTAHVKAMSKFASDIRIHAIDISNQQ